MDAAAPLSRLHPWHRIFYLLAAFDVLIVCISLYVNHRITTIHVQSVRQNRTWGTIERQASKLASLAAEIDRPGNEVFETLDMAGAEVRLQHAVAEYRQQSRAVIVSLQRRHPTERTIAILNQLRAADVFVAEMEAATRVIFHELVHDNAIGAAKQMAKLDRKYASVNGIMFDVVEAIGEIEHEHFDEQIAAAAWFQTFEYALAGAVLFMIAGAFSYAVYANRQFDTYVEERRKAALALRDANDRLERRVAERTSELQAANDNLNTEVAERRRAEIALRHAATIRLRLVDELMTAQEGARRRLAHELHDGVSQMLTSLSFGLQSLAIKVHETDPERVSRVNELHDITAATLDEVRRLARGLRPIVLDDLGLSAALDRLVAEFTELGTIDVRLHCSLDPLVRLPSPVETSVYRLVQEALTNVWRHASAQRVWVRLENEQNSIHASVRDDGRGFDPYATLNDQDEHIGLASMRERIERLKGQFTVTSAIGQGTTICALVPLEVAAHA